MTIKISMREMLEAGVHFGHQSRNWNPRMAPFIFGERQKIHIINLEHTLPMFRDSLEFVARIAQKRGRILFVGTKYAARDSVRDEAIRSGMFYVNHRWLGGMLTNYKTIRRSVKRLKDLESLLEQENFVKKKTKKEILNLTREKDKLTITLNGVKSMGGLPDALFVIDVNEESTAVKEANKLGIPVIAVVDTNANPEGVDYIIPGNDDAERAIKFYMRTVSETIIKNRPAPLENAKPAPAVKKLAPKKRVAEVKDEASTVADSASSPEAPVKKVAKKVVKKEEADTDSVAKKPAPKKKTAAKKPAAKKKTAAKKKVAKKASESKTEEGKTA